MTALQAVSLLSLLLCALAEKPGRGRPYVWTAIGLTGLLVLLIGLRPISGLYVDMTTYAIAFERSKWGISEVSLGDPLFDVFTNNAAAIMPVAGYFFLCAVLYVVPKTIASRLWFGQRATIALAVVASSFSFYAFATNGIRNGIAASFALLAMAWPRLTGKLVLGAAAVFTHISLLLSITAYVIAGRFRSIKAWMAFWLAAIPLSLLIPKSLFSSLASLQIDGRTSYFGNMDEATSGFRTDFILYGAIGVAAIAYWKVIRKIEDREFDRLACTYLIANGVWILINQVAYSNRFAYLSWFLLEIVILFPALRSRSRYTVLLAASLTTFNIILARVIVQ